MIKIASFLLTFCFGLVIISLSSSVFAQTVDLTSYLAPPTPVKVSVGSEVFYSIVNGNEILQCKQDDCSRYQKLFILPGGFGLQGEDHWMSQSNYTFQYRLDNGELAPWLPKTMEVGSLYNSPPLNVVGYFINEDRSLTKDPACQYCGHAGSLSMKFEELGPMEFFNGAKFESVAKFVVAGGPGEGEVFYFAKDVGWIGWEGPSGINLPSSSPLPYTGPAAKVIPNCQFTNPLDTSSRPAEYSICNKGPTAADCATTFSVNDTVTFSKADGSACGGEYYVEKKWGGSVNVDPTKVTIPFVGKKNQEDEAKYLADYFEGTDEYYRKYPDGSAYWLDKINFAGVNRKLTPMEYQNKLKGSVLDRAVQTTNKTIAANPVFDYPLKYQGRICWDFPIITDVVLALLAKLNLPATEGLEKYAHYCLMSNDSRALLAEGLLMVFNNPFNPFKAISFKTQTYESTLTEMAKHQPPKATDPDYEKAWENWANQDKAPFENYGKWFYLWSVTPLSSREDTQGRVKSQAALKTKDKYDIDKYSFMPTFSSVPHAARLYELSSNIQKMLKNTSSVLGDETATDENQVLAQNTTLAQANTSFSLGLDLKLPSGNTPGLYNMDAYMSLSSAPPGCDLSITDNTINISYSVGGGCDLVGSGGDLDQNPERINDLSTCNSPSVYMDIGSSYTINVNVHVKHVGGPNCQWWNSPFGTSCTMTLTSNGFVSTCGGTAPPPPPACGLAPAPNISDCQKVALTDPNPNDKLYNKGVIKANLEAVDSVINPDYTPCIETLEDGTVRYNNDCFASVKASVSRRIAVNLNQPYLKQIWDVTAAPLTGVFNLFRPSTLPAYSPLEAKSKDKVNYEYVNRDGTGTVTPGEGDFYFPYLGGIQQAKEQTIRALTPYKP